MIACDPRERRPKHDELSSTPATTSPEWSSWCAIGAALSRDNGQPPEDTANHRYCPRHATPAADREPRCDVEFTLHLKDSFAWPAQDLHVSLARLVAAVSNFQLTIAMAALASASTSGPRTIRPQGRLHRVAATIVLATFSFALLEAML